MPISATCSADHPHEYRGLRALHRSRDGIAALCASSSAIPGVQLPHPTLRHELAMRFGSHDLGTFSRSGNSACAQRHQPSEARRSELVIGGRRARVHASAGNSSVPRSSGPWAGPRFMLVEASVRRTDQHEVRRLWSIRYRERLADGGLSRGRSVGGRSRSSADADSSTIRKEPHTRP